MNCKYVASLYTHSPFQFTISQLANDVHRDVFVTSNTNEFSPFLFFYVVASNTGSEVRQTYMRLDFYKQKLCS